MIDTVSIHNNDIFIWIKSDEMESWPKWIESDRELDKSFRPYFLVRNG